MLMRGENKENQEPIYPNNDHQEKTIKALFGSTPNTNSIQE
jgi:hypothetical protein